MADNQQIKRIAIVGGGTAGWMAAGILARALPGTRIEITVIESPDIGTVGVGEATIPPIIDLLRFLSINEADFVKHTQSTYKLGIKFTDWSRKGHSYWHPFGSFGSVINLRPFHHAWARARSEGLAPRFNDFSLCAALGDAGKFRFPDAAVQGPVAGLRYALHFDAGLVAQYLRSYSERLGVVRIERTVADTTLRENGLLDQLVFSDGSRLQADLYIDCSGFRGVLIEGALKTGYVEWSDVLPCDRAVALPTELARPRPPYTEAICHSAGWRWRIPLQHRTGNGYVYSSAHIGDTQALDELLAAVGGRPSADPRFLRFVTGRRKLFWNRNCVALGLASGFLEPLESTSIHLVMSGVYKLLEHFPNASFDQSNIDSYNNELIQELERIRDFIVLHYVTGRSDTPLWAYCQSMKLPDSLLQRIELYRRTGRIRTRPGELFTDLSWFYILEGIGMAPESYDPLMDVVTMAQLREILGSMAQATAMAAQGVPAHDSYFSALPAAR
ncbi:MAG TPA: tryptophan halogenase family protein [Steroidobacteraceae bacterium]|jgi:tryptophan halogenase|nr:tryptophan halogenase family protein [Steroidobacteraceae bacterium]